MGQCSKFPRFIIKLIRPCLNISVHAYMPSPYTGKYNVHFVAPPMGNTVHAYMSSLYRQVQSTLCCPSYGKFFIVRIMYSRGREVSTPTWV